MVTCGSHREGICAVRKLDVSQVGKNNNNNNIHT